MSKQRHFESIFMRNHCDSVTWKAPPTKLQRTQVWWSDHLFLKDHTLDALRYRSKVISMLWWNKKIKRRRCTIETDQTINLYEQGEDGQRFFSDPTVFQPLNPLVGEKEEETCTAILRYQKGENGFSFRPLEAFEAGKFYFGAIERADRKKSVLGALPVHEFLLQLIEREMG